MSARSGAAAGPAVALHVELVVPEAHVARSHAVARIAGVAAAAISGVVICGWLLDVRWLAAFSRTAGTTKFNTAVGYAALGLAVTMLGGPSPGRRARRWGYGLAAGAIAVAAITALEYLSGGAYIAEILIKDRWAASEVFDPGRMSVMAMAGLWLIGSGLLLHDARRPALRGLGQACLLASAAVGLLAAVGHLYAVPLLTGLYAIAYPTVWALLLAALGALAARPRQGLMAVILSEHAGGVAARRLLPIAVGVPLILGWLQHVGERYGLVEAQLGTAVVLVLIVGCLVAVVVWLAGELNRADARARLAAQLRQEVESRAAAQAAVAAANDELDRRNQALDRANAELRGLAAIVRSSYDAIISVTLDGTITAWNAAAELLYGYSAQEAIGRNTTMIMPPDHAADLPALLTLVGHGEHIEHFETRRVCKDGRVLDVSVSIAPVFDETGSVAGAATIARDITAGKVAQAEARRLAAIVQFSDDAIIAFELDGRVTAWNAGAELLYGYSAQEAIGKSVYPLIPADQESTMRERITRVGRGEHVDRFDGQRIRKDGTVVDVSISLAPLLDEAGAVTGVSVLAHDITARKAAEAQEQMLRDRSQAAERLESLGKLAGGVAHDFNNMLAIIGNYATFITEQTPPDSTIHADATQITTSAQRAAALADQLMIFARTEPATIEVFDLNTTLADVRRLLQRTLGEDIHLAVTPSDVELPIRADPARIQQVLLNMAFNARDAMPAGGTLIIEATPIDLDPQSTSPSLGLDPGRYARLLVSDTGTGIPPEVVERVFEPFFSTKPKGQGTGLGLATAYGTVTQLGGQIKIYSEVDVGTTMRVYLPLVARPAAEQVVTGPAAKPPRGQGQVVLAVDDEAAIRHLVARILNRNGYATLIAESGPHALSLVEQEHVDLLLTDIIMPEMNGRDLADALRRKDPGLPVIYMSGYSDGLLSAQHLLTETTQLIQKPFTAGELLHTVHTLFTTACATRP
ncbi:PAS domain-containing hybrid sensor histidine kinase/response regulator [Actinoplanes regularis]|uniref:PAS domain-containing hybrid sensor histidine kinase/response regulator n=1 Tax=Actinoplanes regularis TaxID=52697 RepID=UPI002556B385|nr:PAS domain S-box protein [Actinoplanes regularis]